MASDRFLTCGVIRLDTQDERLWVGDKPAHIGGKAFALLQLLMRKSQLLVTKDELFDVVWNGLAVSDAVLTTAVKELRHALDDDARNPVLIETVHRRGYRFMLPVSATDDLPDVPLAAPVKSSMQKPKKIWIFGGFTAALAAALVWLLIPSSSRDVSSLNAATFVHPKSVAVLPFEDLSADASQRWFAEGLTEEIQNRLTRTPDLHVISNLTSASFRTNDRMLSDKAHELGVAHILDGSVRRVADHVRVTAKLIRADDGSQLWSQTYDLRASDVITIQEDVAFRIASALKTVMEPSQLQAMVAAGTRSVEAYEAYLQGLAADQLANATGGRDAEITAIQAYERASKLDPDFAEANWRAAQKWFGKQTRINSSLVGAGATETERMKQYMLRIDRAISGNADKTQQLKYRAAKAVMQMELRKAHGLMVRYLKARPRDIDAWEDMAEFAAYANEHQWLVRAGERIHTLSVEAREPRSRAITIGVMAMQPETAVLRTRQQMEMRPANVMMKYQGHRAMIWAGRIDEARQLLDAIINSDLPAQNKMLAELRQACGEGNIALARAVKARMDASNPDLIDKWQTEQIMGNSSEAAEVLQILDRERRLQTLLQFMINPTFDSAQYPNLRAAMARDGIVRWKVWPMPGACR